MNYFPILLFLLPTFLFGQIQVSDITYQRPYDEYPIKGFMKVDGKEYFIERGLKGTIVSLVTKDSLQFMHELKYRPTDSNFNINVRSYSKSNSGLIYEGPILYECYWDYIYLVNILTGELVEIIDLHTHDIRLQRSLIVGENYYFFDALTEEGKQKIRLDKINGTIDTFPINSYQSGGKIYTISSDSTQLFYFDLVLKEEFLLPFQFEKLKRLRNSSDPQTSIVVQDLNHVYLLSPDHEVIGYDCNLDGLNFFHVADHHFVTYMKTDESEIYSLIDAKDCSLVYTSEFSGLTVFAWTTCFSINSIFGEYFILGSANDWQGEGEFRLYDLASQREIKLDISMDLPFMSQSFDTAIIFISFQQTNITISEIAQIYIE